MKTRMARTRMRDEDEDGPLYQMDALTSEADDLMSSAFKPSHYPK